MRLSKERRHELLGKIRFDAGQPERASRKTNATGFLPVEDHLRALEPDVVLVVGDRGAGKSMLVRVALDQEMRSAAVRFATTARPLSGEVDWKRAWPLDSGGADPRGWRNFVASHQSEREATVELWWAYLLRSVGESLDDDAKERLTALLSAPGGDVDACHAAFRSAGNETLLALDRLDQRLRDEDQWLFVAYDELDTVVISDAEALRRVIRGLVGFWVTYSRRWHRLRGKIFLRTDFYRRFGNVAGADLAKLAANRVELTWSDRNLYALLVKQFANADRDLLKYAQKGRVAFQEEDPTFGHIPVARGKDFAHPFIVRLVGEHMGESAKKGKCYTWILEHLRDGNRKIAPRTLVQLIETAAQYEREQPRASGIQLLHPTSLRVALDKVSEDHVDGAKAELPWLEGLKVRLQDKREVPWDRRELERLLRKNFDGSWCESGDDCRPPVEDPHELLDLLMELGILRERTGKKVDVPDLYLKGLNLLRRGGVRRR